MKIMLLFLGILCLLPVIECANLCDYHAFNWNFYLNHNKDLISLGYNDRRTACMHWKNKGADEGRISYPIFHVKSYCDQFKDIKKTGLCIDGYYSKAVGHFLSVGVPENRVGKAITGKCDIYEIKNRLLTVSVSAMHGGAISSIIYKNKTEILNSYDHGRGLQCTISDSSGENSKLVEAGSEDDGLINNTTSILKSRWYSNRENVDRIVTNNAPAYWKRNKVSDAQISKYTSIFHYVFENVLRCQISITPNKTYNDISLEVPEIHLAYTFDKVYEIDTQTEAYKRIELPDSNTVRYSEKPIMYENDEGIAIGLRANSIKGLENGVAKYAYYGKIGTSIPIDQATKMALQYSTTSFVDRKTVIRLNAYFAVGTLQEVTETLSRIND